MTPYDGRSSRRHRIGSLVERAAPHLGVTDHASTAIGLGLPGFELGLHQNDKIRSRRSEGDQL